MRSYTTVYRSDGTPIEVVTIQNSNTPKEPAAIPAENQVERDKVIESKPARLGPLSIQSEPDR